MSRLGNCPGGEWTYSGELSRMRIRPGGSCPVGEVSWWGVVLVGTCPGGELSRVEIFFLVGGLA